MKSLRQVTIALLLCLVALFGPIDPIPAQETAGDENNEIKLDEVVVTGTRSERTESEIVADVEVFDRAEMEELPFRAWDDLLNRLAGVKMHRPDGIGHRIPLVLNIRGINGSRQNLILLNGLPLNHPGTGFVTFHQVSSEMVDRIEVVKGPYSSLYGSYAMGGVVNAISRRGQSEDGLFVPRAKIGSYGYWEMGAYTEKNFGAIDLAVDFQHRQADNYLFRDKESRYTYNRTTRTTEQIVGDSTNRELRQDLLNISLGAKLNSDNQVRLTFNYLEDHQGAGAPTYVEDIDPWAKERNIHAAVQTNHRLGAGYTLQLAGYNNSVWDRGLGEGVDASTARTRYFAEDADSYNGEWGGQVKLSKSFAEWHMITLGLDYAYYYADWRRNEADSGAITVDAEADMSNAAPYLQMEMFLLDSRLLITPGLRADFHSETESSLSPKLAVRYNFTDSFNVRASAGRSFRAPTLNELYGPTWMMIPGVPFESNPDLDPEYLWSFDLGFKYQPAPGYSFGLAGFYSKGEDFIEAHIANGIQRYINLENVEIYGFEVEATARPCRWLGLEANYTYTEAKNSDTDEELLDQPKHMVKGGVQLQWKTGRLTWGANIFGRWHGDRTYQVGMGSGAVNENDDSTIFDAGVTVTDRSGLTLGLKSTNLFDAEWYSHGTQLGAGRAIWVEAKWQI